MRKIKIEVIPINKTIASSPFVANYTDVILISKTKKSRPFLSIQLMDKRNGFANIRIKELA